MNKHRPQALKSPALTLRHHQVDALQPRLIALAQLFGLHKGEQEALALCIKNPQSLFLTDDAAARTAADSLSITAHGSVGLIVRGVRRHVLTTQQGLDLLAGIPERSSLHIRPSLLASVIRKVRLEWS